MKEEFDFESIKNKAIEQLKAGKPLLGKDGAFAPLLESILNAALEGEMDAHLTDEERQLGNRRNGKMQKQVQHLCYLLVSKYPFSASLKDLVE